jgi:hypothetical protein
VKKIITVAMMWILIIALAACSGSQLPSATGASASETTVVAASEATAPSTAAATPAASAAEALAANSETHDDAEDYVWEESAVIPITLNGDSIVVDGAGVTVDGSTATITSAGTYSLSGSLDDGQIIVNTQDQALVRLILNGVDMHSSSSAPIAILSAEETMIVLADGSENAIADDSSYVFPSADVDEPNAAIFSASDLTITGAGSLTVSGNYNDGIASKDGLIINGGTILVTAADDGIRGKDYLVVKDGNVTVNAQGDGLKADNAEDASKGYLAIAAGTINVTAGGDALTAETDVAVTGGALTLSSGGGSAGQIAEDASAKGIKAAVGVTIDGGTLTIDSADDAIHSNGSVTINAGTFALTSGDDGIHADATLEVNGGNIQVTEAYEGIEGGVITINDGDVHVVSSDDGVNVAGGNDSSGMVAGPGRGGRPGQGSSQDASTYTGSNFLYINGGTLVVDAAGDGLDANGAIVMTGGVVLVNGPTERMNGALDYDGGFNITGGLLVAAGSNGMATAPGTASSQNSVLINYDTVQAAGTLVHIQNSEGQELLTFAPAKDYQSIVLSAPELVAGETYTVYAGGSATGIVTSGWYQDAAYTPGTEYTSFTVADVVTTVGTGMR